MKKNIGFAGILVIFVVCLGLLCTPFVGMYQVVSHPLNTLSDFVGGLLQIDSTEIKDTNDINVQIDKLCSDDYYGTLLTSVSRKYSAITVTPENLIKVFAFSNCKEITESNLKQVADYISQNMSDEIDNEKLINYILQNDPFKSSAQNAELSKENIEYLYQNSDVKGENINVDPNSPTAQKIVEYANSRLGCRYYWGKSGPNYFDCSGLVYWVFNQAGVKLPRTTSSGYSKMGKPISYSQLQKGDVITFSYGNGVEHIGIYIGDGKMINAQGQGSGTVGQYPNQCVKIASVKSGSYFYKYIYNCRRLY